MEEENDQKRFQSFRQVYSKITGFFEARVENLKTPAPPSAIGSLPWKKKKNSNRQ